MNAFVAGGICEIACFSIVAFIPFISLKKRQTRAHWANRTFMLCSVIGIARGSIRLAWGFGWFALSSKHGQVLEDYLSMAGGLLLGFIFSLIFAGQLLGKKAVSNVVQEEPVTAR